LQSADFKIILYVNKFRNQIIKQFLLRFEILFPKV